MRMVNLYFTGSVEHQTYKLYKPCWLFPSPLKVWGDKNLINEETGDLFAVVLHD